MDEIYRTSEAEIIHKAKNSLKRWDLKFAWGLISKKFLVLIFMVNFFSVWALSYVDFIKYIEKQGDNPDRIGRLNIFFEMLDFGIVIGNLVYCTLLGLIPFLIVSYRQTQISSFYSQLAWLALVVLTSSLIWLDKLWSI